MKLIIILFLFLATTTAWADTLVILKKTKAYSQPSKTSRPVAAIKKGRKVTTSGINKNGFYEISTRSEKKLWVFSADVKYISDHKVQMPSEEPQSNFSRLTYDLGFSAGSSGDVSYSEINLGLNYFAQRWLVWRNALFSRFASGLDTTYGLDSSVRAYWLKGFGQSSGFTLFGGPGLRVPNQGNTTPFAEAGMVIQLGGLSLGGGVKSILHSLSNSQTNNDTQYFIILAGSGSI